MRWKPPPNVNKIPWSENCSFSYEKRQHIYRNRGNTLLSAKFRLCKTHFSAISRLCFSYPIFDLTAKADFSVKLLPLLSHTKEGRGNGGGGGGGGGGTLQFAPPSSLFMSPPSQPAAHVNQAGHMRRQQHDLGPPSIWWTHWYGIRHCYVWLASLLLLGTYDRRFRICTVQYSVKALVRFASKIVFFSSYFGESLFKCPVPLLSSFCRHEIRRRLLRSKNGCSEGEQTKKHRPVQDYALIAHFALSRFETTTKHLVFP